jgi:hypothetical protein
MGLELGTWNLSKILRGFARPTPDPFTVEDALAECDMQRLSVDMVGGTALVVFDLKGALFYESANVAVLVGSGLESASWDGDRRLYRTRYQAFPVGSSCLTRSARGSWRMGMGAINGQELVLEASVLAFWTGNVAGGDDAPPMYDEDSEEEIERRLYQWGSVAVPNSFTSTEFL